MATITSTFESALTDQQPSLAPGGVPREHRITTTSNDAQRDLDADWVVDRRMDDVHGAGADLVARVPRR